MVAGLLKKVLLTSVPGTLFKRSIYRKNLFKKLNNIILNVLFIEKIYSKN
jgi:hypothetical protein